MAVDMFLKLDGIDGDSTSHKHKDEIEILSWSWGVSNTSSSSGGGGGAGKVNVQDLSVAKEIGASSPHLMEACCSGKHFSSATLTLSQKKTQQDFLIIKMSDVLISSYQTGAGGGSVPTDSISFNFRSVDIQATSGKGEPTSVQCDFGNRLSSGPAAHDHEK